jgi:hypothetical protein
MRAETARGWSGGFGSLVCACVLVIWQDAPIVPRILLALALAGFVGVWVWWFFTRYGRPKILAAALMVSGIVALLLGAMIYVGQSKPVGTGGPTSRDPLNLQAKELEDLASYISKDPLSKMQEILAYNIGIQNIRTQFLINNPTAQFPYQQSCPSCGIIIRVRDGNWNGSHIDPGQTLDKNGIGLTEAPNEVAYLVIPPNQSGTPDSTTFLSSAYLPNIVKTLFGDYVKIGAKNNEIMADVLDEYRHKGVKFFQEANDPGSPYYNVIVNDFAKKIISSITERQKVLLAIQSSLKTQ